MKWLKRFFSFNWLRKNKKHVPRIKEPEGVGLICPEQYVEHYEKLWTTCSITGTVNFVINMIANNKSRYLKAEELTGVPWFVLASIHTLEGGGKFTRNMVNGQRLDKRTTIVPKGLGPWDSWEQSCVDAMKRRKLPKIWDIANTLYFLEKYNGLGVLRYHRDVNTPYLWSKTNHYKSGKYVADGRWSQGAVSNQTGAVAIMKHFGVILKTSEKINQEQGA